MSAGVLTPIRRAALRLEMAEGRVNALTEGSGAVDQSQLADAIFDRDSERNAFRLAVQDVTQMDPAALARLLSI